MFDFVVVSRNLVSRLILGSLEGFAGGSLGTACGLAISRHGNRFRRGLGKLNLHLLLQSLGSESTVGRLTVPSSGSSSCVLSTTFGSLEPPRVAVGRSPL